MPPAATIVREVQRPLRAWAQDSVEFLTRYPPQSGGSTYVRTGNLGRRWRFEFRGPFAVEVFNDASSGGTKIVRGPRRGRRGARRSRRFYAVHVQGPDSGPKGEHQAAAMADRGWRNVSDAKRLFEKRHKGMAIEVLTRTGRRR